MSHVVTIKSQVRDPVAVDLACKRLTLPAPVFGPTKLFNAVKTGWAVRLPEWLYPIVCDTANGQVEYDNFEGRWGSMQELDRFMQAYAVEKAKLEARKAGHSVTESAVQDGGVKLTVVLSGGTA